MATKNKGKVVYFGQTLMDLTQDTASDADVLLGATLHTANGEATTGKLRVVYVGPEEPSDPEHNPVWVDTDEDVASFLSDSDIDSIANRVIEKIPVGDGVAY